MASAHEKRFSEGISPFLELGERVVASCIAQAKGFSRMTVSGLQLGKAEVGRAAGAAAAGEVRVDNPMALALTDRRLLTVKISVPIGFGLGGKVKEVMTAIPLGTNAKAGAGELASEFERLKGA